MTTIELRFPAHRFHATPWGRHVNEGVPEWPPSPYRLLRALYDGWKRKHPELPAAEVEAVFVSLAREMPHFRLPPATAAHTRSYLHTNTIDPTDKTLIFDAFVAVPRNPGCFLCWETVELTVGQKRVLGTLLGSLNYLGRSESWVEAALVADERAEGWRCEPLEHSETGGETVPVACALPPASYRSTAAWFEALAYSTTQLLKDRRSAPPAMRMVPYVRPFRALETRVARAPTRNRPGVQAVLLGLDSPVLPLATAAIEVAERVRRRLMGIHKRIMGGDPARVSPLFSGKDRQGKPLAGHEHAFILPLAKDNRITRILLFTKRSGGFEEAEIHAILALRELERPGYEEPIRIVATWQGKCDDALIRPRAPRVASTTPFVPPRHWRKGRPLRQFLEAELRRECANHGLPDPVRVEWLNEPAAGFFQWVEFRRNRKEDPVRPLCCGFRLEFPEAVPAPFSLGYACHFGLGQFAPE